MCDVEGRVSFRILRKRDSLKYSDGTRKNPLFFALIPLLIPYQRYLSQTPPHIANR